MTKNEDLIYVHAPRNKGLGNLLYAWTRVVLRYCELHRFEDNPWWANERASISTLAAAAWTLEGWCALEEFSTRKHGIVPSRKVKQDGLKNGRCDLYVGNKSTSYVFEAKQAWQPIGVKENDNIRFQKSMEAAWDDAGKIRADEAHHRYAATFVIPYVSKTRAGVKGTDVREKVNTWLDSKNIPPKSKRPLFYAYVFPGRDQNFVHKSSGRAFPGVMLVLEERKHARKSNKS